MDKCFISPSGASAGHLLCKCYATPVQQCSISPEVPGEPLRCVVGLGGLGLDHDGRVATLVILRFVGDGPHHIAGRESECRTQCRQSRDEHRNDDFDDLLFLHNTFVFLIRLQRYVNTEQCVPWQVEILSKNRIFFVYQLLDNTI